MPDEYFIPWLSSNIIALILLFFCWKYPKIGRYAYAIIFLLAAFINITTAIGSPELYLEYSKWTFLKVYERFIEGYFKEHITGFVTIIGLGQLLVSLGLLIGSYFYKPALIGGLLFAIGILPLGMGSGFPAPVFMIMSFWLLLTNKKINIPESSIS
ncbi:hypothetical protein [Fulvivirga sp.]|uniref:hypothetical protein n=1 Tax=Fulvivirga sp. TaxID=1931237 RepID=UPI0032EE2B4E